MREPLALAAGLLLCGTARSSSTAPAGGPLIATILLEHPDYAEVVGSANVPYLNSLIDQYGLATNYFDSGTHPSLPNYLYMISGDPQYSGGLDLLPTSSFDSVDFPVQKDNLGNQMQK